MRKNACDLRIAGFFVGDSRSEALDEEEYEEYLRVAFDLHEYEFEHEPLQEQLRDEGGNRVDGCYRTKRAPSQ